MKIYRFSDDGFVSQYQDHHYKQVLLETNDDWFYNDCLPKTPEHLKHISIKRHEERKEFFKSRLDDFKYGIWAFTSRRFRRRSLNHLKVMPKFWEAEIDDNVYVYDVDFKDRFLITKCPCADSFGCYIPENQLSSLRNIKELNNIYEGKTYKEFYKRM